jgi:hypothetical protein
MRSFPPSLAIRGVAPDIEVQSSEPNGCPAEAARFEGSQSERG